MAKPAPDPIEPDGLLWDGPRQAGALLILAHGAGAPMDSPFMADAATALADEGIRVARFEFPYMAGRRLPGGSKRPPDRLPVLTAAWHGAIAKVRHDAIADGVDEAVANRPVIGGKSMGGRIASLIAAEHPELVSGLVCLGYPVHAAGRAPAEDEPSPRAAHLASITCPTLICQGERDSMGSADLFTRLPLSPTVRLCVLPDGDHSFKPRKASGHTEAENWATAWTAVGAFLRDLTP